jgi:hypothetical protein
MGTVVTYAPQGGEGTTEHEIAARVAVARALAALQGFGFGGGYEPGLRRAGEALYFVPSQTLGADEARSLGIRGEHELFGGVVPFPFVAHKTIAHALVAPDASRPRGWCDAFAERVRGVVLPGFAAFTREDARRAARELLRTGPARIKRGRGIGGKGQAVVETPDDPAFDALDAEELAQHGVVLEPNLVDLTTYSVGQVRVGGMLASYCGTQKLTRDNAGQPAYGGSDLLVVRGGFEELERLSLPPHLLTAIRQARAFDQAADAAFPALVASRRNYDVLRGRDARPKWHCGVLEQSWRIGGASGPEVAALAAFRAEPRLRAVHARSTETYDAHAAPPPHAIVHFRGVDRAAGPITKYTVVEPYERAQ